jgi:hypothetical protein
VNHQKNGKIIIPHGVTIWSHEFKTAQVLAKSGYTVEFIVENRSRHAKSADIIINGLYWEIKSPRTDKLSAIERNLKRASKQSENIIIDSQRLSKLHDSKVQRKLAEKLKSQKSIARILFINRNRQVIDISTFI